MMAAAQPADSAGQPRASRYRRHATARITTRFLGPGQVAALCMAIIVLAVLLFPGSFIKQQLRGDGPPNAATITYLELLLRAQPNDQVMRLQLVRERLRAGQLDLAESELAPLASQSGPHSAQVASLWLGLRRAEFVALPVDSPQRERGGDNYARALRTFGSQLSPADQLSETRQAIADGLYVTAAQLAGNLLTTTESAPPAAIDEPGAPSGRAQPRAGPSRAKRDPALGLAQLVGLVWSSRLAGHSAISTQPPDNVSDLRDQAFQALLQGHLAAGHPQDALRAAEAALPSFDPARVDWAQLIRIAGWADQPTAAADFARRWLAHAGDDATRWIAFHALIDAYLAAARPDQALLAATRNMGRMPQTTELWRVMTRLAMQAGNAEQSAAYARRLVQLDPAHGD